jgi:hypothetical protein
MVWIFSGSHNKGCNRPRGSSISPPSSVAQGGLNTDPSQTPDDSVSLSDNAVSLMSASNLYDADLGVAHAAKEMEKATLSLLA